MREQNLPLTNDTTIPILQVLRRIIYKKVVVLKWLPGSTNKGE